MFNSNGLKCKTPPHHLNDLPPIYKPKSTWNQLHTTKTGTKDFQPVLCGLKLAILNTKGHCKTTFDLSNTCVPSTMKLSFLKHFPLLFSRMRNKNIFGQFSKGELLTETNPKGLWQDKQMNRS